MIMKNGMRYTEPSLGKTTHYDLLDDLMRPSLPS